jgi:hypothetical protein
MPLFTTSINLIAATDQDYDFLSRELEKKSFRKLNESPSRFSSNQPSLMDVTVAVSEAASHTGRKFTYSVIRDKSQRS